MEYTDKELLKLLKENREEGAAALMEQYTGLLWSVCARRLSDAEDIRECVNMTFAKFCLYLERYSSDECSLKNYLCLMADRCAVNRYHREKKHERIANKVKDRYFETLHSDRAAIQKLEEALGSLEPIDEAIIRMKYYGGLSYEEIAGQLGLSYEAVRKRSQRSRHKLWKLMLFILLISLLAACAGIAVYRFHFLGRFGFSWSSEAVYQMAGEPQSFEIEDVTVTVIDAVYVDGEARVYLQMKPLEEGTGHGVLQICRQNEMWCLNGVPADDGYDMVQSESGMTILELVADCPIKEGKASVILLLESVFYSKYREHDQKYTELWGYLEDNHEQLVDKADVTLELVLEKVPEGTSMEQLGKVIRYQDRDLFLIGAGEESDGFVKVPIYPLESPDGYMISNLLTTSYTGLGTNESKKVVLTAEDGTVIESVRTGIVSTIEGSSFEVWFPVLNPGKYQLMIPQICLEKTEKTAEVSFALPLENESVSCDEVLTFSDGCGIHVTGISCTVEDAEIYNDAMMADTQTSWKRLVYSLEYELIQTQEIAFCTSRISSNFVYGPDIVAEESVAGGGAGIRDDAIEVYVDLREDVVPVINSLKK